eukprot:239345-Prorocentrum_minimum.AAC.1
MQRSPTKTVKPSSWPWFLPRPESLRQCRLSRWFSSLSLLPPRNAQPEKAPPFESDSNVEINEPEKHHPLNRIRMLQSTSRKSTRQAGPVTATVKTGYPVRSLLTRAGGVP